MATEKKERAHKGLSIRKIQLVMACVILVISVLLLVATFSAQSGYIRMRNNTDDYIQWERDAKDLQIASDYLTEQVRCFVETGKREYLDSYFEEAEITRRRDKALANIRVFMGESQACDSLQTAMDESMALMDREYYAMRLTIAAYGYDCSLYPQVIQDVELTEEDALLPPERQEALARSKVFDDVYHMRKETITQNVQACLYTLASEIGQRQVDTSQALENMLYKLRLLIIAAIGVTLFTMVLTMLLVISPLLRAVMYIRADEPIPVKGSDEFQFLARTYNLMYEVNREQKEHLAFEATHDPLTGIYNRSGYDFFMANTEWSTSFLLLFDVDRFKQYNDTYGHETGDEILRKVAATIRDCFRSQDYVCRIGGDEFAVIMVHTSSEHVDLIRSKVERINDALRGGTGDMPGVHVSCGAAFGGSGSGDTRAIFERADSALYRVKDAGGCGCEVSA